MKSKLRNDKLTLMDIKNDLTKFNKKPKPHINQDEETFALADITDAELNKSSRNSNSNDRALKSKVLELKK
jgi:hypothetical protein